MIERLAGVALAACAAWVAYTWAGYPLWLWLMGRRRPPPGLLPPPVEWPPITVVIPVFNGAAVIRSALDAVLALDYPADRRQVLVVSDASTDETDAIVVGYAARGVELLRLDRRAGKTAAENAAHSSIRGDVVINTDAAIRLHPEAAKRLVSALGDPAVGVASGQDLSVAAAEAHATLGEWGYVGYEMWVRGLETRVGGIVGASGSLYAIRRQLQVPLVPEALSRDFAAVLIARERGYRSVSVADAICVVPRAGSLRQEYFRKVRTMTRGLETLWYKRQLLDPRRFGTFAWMLFSHKLCRWLVPCVGIAGLGALTALAPAHRLARWALGAVLAMGVAGLTGWLWPTGRRPPRILSLAAYAGASTVAALHAWAKVLRRDLTPAWEPTRRPRTPG